MIRQPPACKTGALPIELLPLEFLLALGSHIGMGADNLPQSGLYLELMAPQSNCLVGDDGFEPPT